MKSVIISVILVSSSAWANDSLLQKNNCLACHNVTQTVVGPSFQAVANKNRGQADAADKLARKIRLGGSGVWGAMPMPAHPQISDADAKKLAAHVLNTK